MTSGRAGRIRWHVAAIWMIGLFTLQFVAPHALAADKFWNLPQNGVFTLASNWFGGVPGPDDVARFETTNSNFQSTYTVSFANDPINQQLVVEEALVLDPRDAQESSSWTATACRSFAQTSNSFDFFGTLWPATSHCHF
jgi:hypothetical protein